MVGSHVNDAEIDRAVLSIARPQWQKVAMIIAKVSTTLRWGEEDLNRIAARIQLLVSLGELQSQGNLEHWRNSEVRLPSSD
jgi:hypothetical protein